MGKDEHSPPQCPVCGNLKVKIHCTSGTCGWYRCDLAGCATIFDARRYIRNVIA